MLKIRLFQPEDFERVVAIERAAFAEDYAPLFVQLYEMSSDGFYVAEADGLVVGYIVAALTEDREGRVFSLAVDPAFRKRGVAAALLERALELYRSEGIPAVRLEVRVDNAPAQALYRRFGFEPVGRLPSYYSDGADALVMRKPAAGGQPLPGPKPLPFPLGPLQRSPHG